MTFFYLSVSSIFRIRAPNIGRFLREGGKIFRRVFETYFGSQTVSKTPGLHNPPEVATRMNDSSVETRCKKKNDRRKRGRARRVVENEAAKRIQYQTRIWLLCDAYALMTPKKERLLDRVTGDLRGTLFDWYREAQSMYFHSFCIRGTFQGNPVRTSWVMFLFVRDGRTFAYTSSHNLYELCSEWRDHGCVSLETSRTLELIELRHRILTR